MHKTHKAYVDYVLCNRLLVCTGITGAAVALASSMCKRASQRTEASD